MSNKKLLKKIIEEDLNKEKNYNSIMSKIENNGERKLSFKLKYASLVAIIIVAGIVGVSARVGNITKNYKIDVIKDSKDNLPVEERNEKHILFDNKINKDYDSNLFKKDKQYTYKEIEERLQLKLLKNKNFDSNIYRVNDLTAKDDKIAKLRFSQIKPNKDFDLEKYYFNFTISTKYYDEDNTVIAITHGLDDYIEYYIKSLNTMALIDKPKKGYSGPTHVYFSYNDVVYTLNFSIVYFDVLEIDRAHSSSIPITETELYDFLEAFTLD